MHLLQWKQWSLLLSNNLWLFGVLNSLMPSLSVINHENIYLCGGQHDTELKACNYERGFCWNIESLAWKQKYDVVLFTWICSCCFPFTATRYAWHLISMVPMRHRKMICHPCMAAPVMWYPAHMHHMFPHESISWCPKVTLCGKGDYEHVRGAETPLHNWYRVLCTRLGDIVVWCCIHKRSPFLCKYDHLNLLPSHAAFWKTSCLWF